MDTTKSANRGPLPRVGRPTSRSEQLAAEFATALAAANVEVVYGVPGGGHNLDLIGAVEAAGLRFVLTHLETAAAIMAAVDGELSHRSGACLFTRGPGAASAVNGVAHAMLDRAPLAAIADDVPLSELSRVPHQYVDQQALFAPITKWSGRVGLDGAGETLARVLQLADGPPPGPVQFSFDPDAPRSVLPAIPQLHQRAQPLSDATRLLRNSRRPVLVIGVGAKRSAAELREALGGKPWPVLTTYKAKGLIPETWANAAGLLTGATSEGDTLRAADLIVAIGLDPVELIPAPWPYAAPVLALSEWPTVHPYFAPRCELVGSIAGLLGLVDDELDDGFDGEPPGRAARLAHEHRLAEITVTGIGPHDVVRAARAASPEGTIATVDSGAHMLVAMPLWEVQANDEILISSGLATMAFALPAAIAAALARPGRRVVCFTGDGGLGMVLAELETLARLRLPVTVIVFNDSALSLIEIKQRPTDHGGSNAVRYHASDYAGVAESLGVGARRVKKRDDLMPALLDALADPGPVLVDIAVDPTGYREVLRRIRGGSYEGVTKGTAL